MNAPLLILHYIPISTLLLWNAIVQCSFHSYCNSSMQFCFFHIFYFINIYRFLVIICTALKFTPPILNPLQFTAMHFNASKCTALCHFDKNLYIGLANLLGHFSQLLLVKDDLVCTQTLPNPLSSSL